MSIICMGSGAGTTIDYLLQDQLCRDKVDCVITSNPDAVLVDVAKSYNIDCHYCKHNTDDAIQIINSNKPDIVLLLGYMRMLTQEFLQSLTMPIYNLHPSILPSFKGMDALNNAINYGVAFIGSSIHTVVEEMDAGKIAAQCIVPVISGKDNIAIARCAERMMVRLFVKKFYNISDQQASVYKLNIDDTDVMINFV